MLTIGDRLPHLVLAVQEGAARPSGETIELGRATGRWMVLFYWPQDFTFVCPTEVVGYGELRREFARRGAELIGASTDTAEVHFAWRRSDEQLAQADFPWIADSGRELAAALGILDGQGKVGCRATFILDPNGVVQHVTAHSLSVGRNPRETLRVLDALLTHELCPSNWHPGEPTLGLG